MQQKKIEGMGVFSENGDFSFQAGLPKSEPVLPWKGSVKRGRMTVSENADASFTADGPCGVLPPAMDEVFREEGLLVKRTSRNYIVTMKVPIIETAEETKKRHAEMWKKSSAAIKSDRDKIKEVL